MLTTEKAGVIAVRAAGIVLTIIGLASVISWLVLRFTSGPLTGGWTSYSPLEPSVSPAEDLLLHDSYYVVADVTTGVLPGALQAGAGLLLFFGSRTVGRFLVVGLDAIKVPKCE